MLLRVWQEPWWKPGEFTTGQSESKSFLSKFIHSVLSKLIFFDLKLLAQFHPWHPGLQSCSSLRTSHTTSATRSKTDCWYWLFFYFLVDRFHEFEIRKQCPEVFVIRKTLTEMANDARLDEVGSISVQHKGQRKIDTRRYNRGWENLSSFCFDLFLNRNWYQDKRLWVGEIEVGVVYMRCGYHPDQYPTERWQSMKSKSIWSELSR